MSDLTPVPVNAKLPGEYVRRQIVANTRLMSLWREFEHVKLILITYCLDILAAVSVGR